MLTAIGYFGAHYKMHGQHPFVFIDLKTRPGLEQVTQFIATQEMLA